MCLYFPLPDERERAQTCGWKGGNMRCGRKWRIGYKKAKNKNFWSSKIICNSLFSILGLEASIWITLYARIKTDYMNNGSMLQTTWETSVDKLNQKSLAFLMLVNSCRSEIQLCPRNSPRKLPEYQQLSSSSPPLIQLVLPTKHSPESWVHIQFTNNEQYGWRD